jgi:hypothetical protein
MRNCEIFFCVSDAIIMALSDELAVTQFRCSKVLIAR